MDAKNRKKIEQEAFRRRKENCENLLKMHLSCPTHKYPTSRRQFLEAGLISFAASMTLPPLLSPLSIAQAQAAGCGPSGSMSDDLPGFFTVSLAGGAGLMGQVQYSQRDGTPLSSYTTHGVGGGMPETEELMGAPFWTRSDFARGLKDTLTGLNAISVLDNAQLIAVPCNNRDDTGENEQDISGLILNIGKKGQFIQNTGTGNNEPGRLRHLPALESPPSALRVARFSDLTNAVSLSGALGNLTPDQATKLARFVNRLSEVQTRRLAAETVNGSTLKRVLDCATGENVTLIQRGVSGLNPVDNEVLSTIWNINAGNSGNGFNGGNADNVGSRFVTAAIANATLLGIAGPVGVTLGGYDYHAGQSRAQADQKDQQWGQYVARLLASASALNKKIAIYVPTDGSVITASQDNSDEIQWRGDNSARGSYWLILFDPAGRPQLSGNPDGGPNWQIGGYTNTQTVDRDFFTGGSSALAAASLAINYALFAGKGSEIPRVFGSSFTAQQIAMVSRVAA